MTELTLGEYRNVLSYMIDNNRRLVDKGDTPISVCLEGAAGTGKTQTTQQIAKEKGMTFVKINLAQIEEPAELVGFPFKEYKIVVEHDGVKEDRWMPADLLKEMNCEYIATSESRMSYAVPAWVPREFNPNGTMLLLDDFSRANSLIIQAVMEIINTGSYVSWSLPKYTNIVLTSNPDNGEYNVTSCDSATLSRMVTLRNRFDIQEWAHWAEMFGIDGRAINFALLYASEIFEPKNNVVIANARSYTTFCRSISGIPNWESKDSLALILQIASGCFLESENTIGALFTRFIHNKLDKLITPERLVSGPWEAVAKEVEQCVYDGDEQRLDIASLLGTRFKNYADKHFNTDKAKSADVLKRILAFFNHPKSLLSEDVLYDIVKTLAGRHPNETQPWFREPKLRSIAV